MSKDDAKNYMFEIDVKSRCHLEVTRSNLISSAQVRWATERSTPRFSVIQVST